MEDVDLLDRQPSEPSHNSHKTLDNYPTMHHFVTEMCTRAHFCYIMVHCGIWDWCIVGFVQQVYLGLLSQFSVMWSSL